MVLLNYKIDRTYLCIKYIILGHPLFYLKSNRRNIIYFYIWSIYFSFLLLHRCEGKVILVNLMYKFFFINGVDFQKIILIHYMFHSLQPFKLFFKGKRKHFCFIIKIILISSHFFLLFLKSK